MQELRKRELVEPLKRVIAEGKPFLGICPGLRPTPSAKTTKCPANTDHGP